MMGLFWSTRCEQDVAMTTEMMDVEIVQTATNVGDCGDNNDDEPPQEVLTSSEPRNLLHLLRDKVECSDGEDQLMQCVKNLEDAF